MRTEVQVEIDALLPLDLHQLRAEWARRFGRAPPFRSTDLLRLLLAWRIQALAFGGLDDASRKALARTGAVVAEGLDLGVGATLRRQWNGQEEVVTVVEGGFEWDRRMYRSLSAVASAIAGTKWNGPRFFGLRR